MVYGLWSGVCGLESELHSKDGINRAKKIGLGVRILGVMGPVVIYEKFVTILAFI